MSNPQNQFGGEEQFTVEPARLFYVLTNIDSVAAMIPDLESSKQIDAQTLECVVRPGFSFLRGTLKMLVKMTDVLPPDRATMQVTAQGIGVNIEMVSHLEVAAHSFGSLLKWQAEVVSMKGLISPVSTGLVRAAADQVIRHVWKRVHEKVDP